MKRVLFVCVHNSGRSQMAAAFARWLGEGRVEVESAGTRPAEIVNPIVVAAMREKSIDISASVPKSSRRRDGGRADGVITMGCSLEEACPAGCVPSQDWGLDDPAGKTLGEVRAIRDRVEAKVRELLAHL